MRTYTTIKYDRRTPQCQVICALQSPAVTWAITGTIADGDSGEPYSGIGVEFVGLGTVYSTAPDGRYTGIVPDGWSGTAIPHSTSGSFVPELRVYSAVAAHYTNQDYAYYGYPVPPVSYYTVSGSFTDMTSTLDDLEVYNGTATWFADSVTGSYAFMVPSGWSGSAVSSRYLSGDSPRVLTNVVADSPGNDFLLLEPFLTNGGPFLMWSFGVGNPDRWFVQGQNPIDLTFSVVGTTAGSIYSFDTTPNTGSLYTVIGVDTLSRRNTLVSNLASTDAITWAIFGTYSMDGTTGGEPFLLSNGTTTLLADGVDGSWQFVVPDGWSGTIRPVSYISDPQYYAYGSVTADVPDQNFANPKPFLTNADPVLAWFWTLPNPDRWIIYAQNPVDLTYSVYGTTAGTDTDLDTTPNTGTYYHIRGVDVNTEWATIRSDDVQTSPPSPPLIGLSGSVFSALYGGTGIPANLFVDGIGTINADSGGNWITSVFSPYTGNVYVVDVTGGTYEPSFRSYVGETVDQFNQDFVFWDEVPPSGDCPIPAGLISITDLPTPNAVSRSVNDPINNLLWYLDDNFDFVYYVDAIAGTFAGSVVMPAGFGQASIVYEPLSHRVVVMDWSGSIHVINPDTKVATRVPDIDMVDPGFHMLAINDTGTVYATDNRQGVTGSVWAINPATATLIKTTKLPVFTDSICWASNINKLFINSGGSGQPAFYLFDPLTDVFEASTLLNPAVSFRYENFYIPSLGHVLESFSGGQPSAVIDISQGTAATQIATIEPTRVSNATIDTCNDRLFVADGNFAIWEFSLDGSYTMINRNEGECGLGISPNSLSHNRATNLVYYADFSNGSIYTVQATRESGSLGIDQCVIVNTNPDFSGGMADSHAGSVWWSGSAVGEDSTPFNSFNFTSYGALANIDTAYAAQVLVVFTGSIADSGTIDIPSNWSINLTLDSYSTNFSVNGTNGFVSGTVILDGTIDYGFTGNAFGVNVQATNGGNFTVAPCNTFVQTTGTAYFTPLTPP